MAKPQSTAGKLYQTPSVLPGRFNNPCAPAVSCGGVGPGTIGLSSSAPPWKYHSFTASSNDVVTVKANTVYFPILNFIPYIEIYSSSGSVIASGAGQITVTVTVSGAYLVSVRDQNQVYSGNYVLTWQRFNNPCGQMITCGQTLSGSVGPVGEVDFYNFTVSSGESISLIATTTGGDLVPNMDLYSGTGTKIISAYGNPATLSQTLTTGGTYTVFVSDKDNNKTGSYTLKFQKNNNACPEVTVTAPNGGEILEAGTTFTLTWIASALQSIASQEIRLSTDGGATYPTVIASGLTGDVRSYQWVVPSIPATSKGRIRVTVTDNSSATTSDESDGDLAIVSNEHRTYVYDELNRLIQVIYEDGRRINYTYDAAGNRLTLTRD